MTTGEQQRCIMEEAFQRQRRVFLRHSLCYAPVPAMMLPAAFCFFLILRARGGWEEYPLLSSICLTSIALSYLLSILFFSLPTLRFCRFLNRILHDPSCGGTDGGRGGRILFVLSLLPLLSGFYPAGIFPALFLAIPAAEAGERIGKRGTIVLRNCFFLMFTGTLLFAAGLRSGLLLPSLVLFGIFLGCWLNFWRRIAEIALELLKNGNDGNGKR